MSMLAKLTRVEIKLVAREPFSVIFTLAFPLIVLIVISGSFGDQDPAFGGATPSDYYLSSYVGVVIGAVGLVTLPVHIAAYIERGILRRFQASSISTWTVLAAQLIVGFLMAVVSSIVLVIAGWLVYDAAMPENLPGVMLGFVTGAATFLVVGLLIAVFTRNTRAAQAVGMMLFFPMWLLSGAGPPPYVMSDGMQAVSDVLPLTFVVRAIQDPWLGDGLDQTSLLLLVALLAITGAITARMAARGN